MSVKPGNFLAGQWDKRIVSSADHSREHWKCHKGFFHHGRFACLHENIPSKQSLPFIDPFAVNLLHHFQFGNKAIFNGRSGDFPYQISRMALLATNNLNHI